MLIGPFRELVSSAVNPAWVARFEGRALSVNIASLSQVPPHHLSGRYCDKTTQRIIFLSIQVAKAFHCGRNNEWKDTFLLLGFCCFHLNCRNSSETSLGRHPGFEKQMLLLVGRIKPFDL